MNTKWTLEDVHDPETGAMVPTLIRYMSKDTADGEGRPMQREEMGSVNDFIRLFKACQRRWSDNGWDIEKLIAAVNQCEFD